MTQTEGQFDNFVDGGLFLSVSRDRWKRIFIVEVTFEERTKRP